MPGVGTARLGDSHACQPGGGLLIQGEPTVLTDGLPTVTMTHQVICAPCIPQSPPGPGIVMVGNETILIAGLSKGGSTTQVSCVFSGGGISIIVPPVSPTVI